MANHPALQRRRDYAGPALFSYGFLFAGVWAVVSLPLWLHQYYGDISLPTHLAPMDWHAHETLYGYATAAISGFLPTAISAWTGRPPVNGGPLANLATLWIAGRLTIMFSAKLGGVIAGTIDSAFLLCLAAVAAREIIAGKNWRNLRVLGIIALLALGNIVFHIEALVSGSANYGTRIAIAAVILLVSLIGGRVDIQSKQSQLWPRGPHCSNAPMIDHARRNWGNSSIEREDMMKLDCPAGPI